MQRPGARTASSVPLDYPDSLGHVIRANYLCQARTAWLVGTKSVGRTEAPRHLAEPELHVGVNLTYLPARLQAIRQPACAG